MFELILNKAVPINLIFFLGYFLKKTGALNEEDGRVFLKGMFYAFIPAILFQSVRKTQFEADFLVYPLVIIMFQILMFILGKLLTSRMKISRDKKIVIRGSLIIMNSGFVVPFYIAFYGVENMWRMGLYDFGNSLMVFVLVYSMFLRSELKEVVKSLRSPPIAAIVLGIIAGKFGIPIPEFIDTTLNQIGNLVGPSIMLGLGLYFTPSLKNIKISLLVVGLKIVLGVGIGLLLIQVLPFDSLSNKTVLYMTASPVGANILTFAVLSKMDTKFPSEIVSLSIVINLFLIPLLFILI
ncbi:MULTISPECIES: AEC family transporter [Psychrilyobacter]|uniref:AEC family transporter n=1 Tax=Psychrilyobacter piezotolerans TaxID=2293438 RepID=A0ABX9KFH8_9FUSO|nr:MULTISPECIES: AEC family transporter [Psychrilyobacter]MCS5422156.1 AEC family transporter [Psychrilyobacter sp. S5]NDI78440.1 hypothetical protein [Psychrilyobacter piezotolerans]RDE60624.1 hypothetical protein DV867_10355 [Psychrilyobacter sp. S5]REI40551.1 hypothetical protein DYH56_10355 [Psychrilyobacter piezotolerans]